MQRPKKNFEERLLLKIRRQYSETEAVKLVLTLLDQSEQALAQAYYRVGELTSEVDELRYERSGVKTTKQWHRDEYVQHLLQDIKGRAKKNSQLRREVVEWRNKYFDLLARSNSSSF